MIIETVYRKRDFFKVPSQMKGEIIEYWVCNPDVTANTIGVIFGLDANTIKNIQDLWLYRKIEDGIILTLESKINF